MSRLIICTLCFLAATTRAATPPELPAGLTLAFTQNNKTDTRSARLLSLSIPAGSTPTPFLAPGPFHAKFEGYLETKIRGDYKFTAIGNGKLKLAINDKPLLDATGDLSKAEEKSVSLKKGKNKIVAEYDSPETGDALVRILWGSDDFAPEPVDPRLLVHDPSDELTKGTKLRDGRLLFADLRCVRCHGNGEPQSSAMPELAQDAPDLTTVGSRIRQTWIAHWVADPKSLRPDTTMPNLLHANSGHPPQDAADLAAYLSSLGPDLPEVKFKDNDSVMGGRIVARLGCIGCHTLPDRDPSVPDARGRIASWRNIKAKYLPAGLVAFLKKPDEHFAWIRMPNFHFSDDEARQIAAYLLNNSKDLDEEPKGNPVKGQHVFETAGCLNCHKLADKKASRLADFKDLAKGCLAKDITARGKAPDFGLDDTQRDALLAFLATDRASLKQDAAPEFAERQIHELGCVNCHSRDRMPDAWDDLIKETESLSRGDTVDVESSAGGKGLPGEPAPGTGDQQRPPLTWVGEKLNPQWMADFIAGKIDYKPRAWMRARMPSFPARADGIAKGLAIEHAVSTTIVEERPADAELAKQGKQLVSRNGGLSCVQCHGIGAIGPIAPFEAPSINFKYVNERLRKDYFIRWMRDPIRVVPTTKMPKFQNDGKTALTDILDGDSDKQFDAIWEYLKAGRKTVHPEQQ